MYPMAIVPISFVKDSTMYVAMLTLNFARLPIPDQYLFEKTFTILPNDVIDVDPAPP
jgi:hypothetical protein